MADSGSAWGNISEISMLEKNAIIRSEIGFVLQEEIELASSDISYLLDEASCVPDLKFHWAGGQDLVSVCLGREGWGAGGEERGLGSSYRAGGGNSQPQTSKAPRLLRKRKLQ